MDGDVDADASACRVLDRVCTIVLGLSHALRGGCLLSALSLSSVTKPILVRHSTQYVSILSFLCPPALLTEFGHPRWMMPPSASHLNSCPFLSSQFDLCNFLFPSITIVQQLFLSGHTCWWCLPIQMMFCFLNSSWRPMIVRSIGARCRAFFEQTRRSTHLLTL